MIEKLKKKWASNEELTKKVNELVEENNITKNVLLKLLKQTGWEE